MSGAEVDSPYKFGDNTRGIASRGKLKRELKTLKSQRKIAEQLQGNNNASPRASKRKSVGKKTTKQSPEPNT